MGLGAAAGKLGDIARSAYRARIRHLPLSGFERAFREVEPYAMVGPRHLQRLYRSVGTLIADGVTGNIVECGCARGGSAALLGLALKAAEPVATARKVWLYDSFEGMPEPSANDPDYDRAVKFVGTCRGELDTLKALMANLKVDERMVFVKGLYSDSLRDPQCFPIALLHIDCDWYESVKICLDQLYAGVSSGGIVQIDDYLTWEGCKKAVDEFVAAQRDKLELKRADSRSVWFRKP